MAELVPVLPRSWSGAPRRRTALNDLPVDVLLEIAGHLSSTADVLHLAQTCTRVHASVLPVLYRAVTLHTHEQCLDTLRAFCARPQLAHHVRALVLCPDGAGAGDAGDAPFRPGAPARALDTTRDVAEAVRHAARHLRALRSFVWDAPERPPDDDMWFALRLACPLLKNVGASVGSFLPDRHGHVFDFKDLTGFSLSLKEGFYVDHATDGWPGEEIQFPRLWQMLAASPRLSTLVLSGCSARPVDMLELCAGRWPALRTLVLGDVSVQHPHLLAAGETPPFAAFLAAHPALRTLHLGSRCGVPAAHLALLPPDALPALAEFGGALEHAARLPAPVRARLHTLRLLEPLSLRDVTPLQVAGVLQGMSALAHLSLAVVLHASYDHGGIMRAIVSGCPGLLELDFTCAYKPCFLLDTFARTIRPLTKLRALHVALVQVPGEESAAAGAGKLARAAPRLEHFAVTHLRDRTPLPLRLAPPAPFDARGAGCAGDDALRGSRSARARLRALGASTSTAYALVRDAHGLPVRLDALELRARAQLALPLPWPYALLAPRLAVPLPSLPADALRALPSPARALAARVLRAPARRSFSHDLRPAGHPDAPRARWCELLLCDRTPAGEEARLFAFCIVLGSVAAWAFLSCLRGK